MNYLVFLVVFIIGLNTLFYGIRILREKNYSGFVAVILLALAVMGLPFYMMFLR